MRVLCWHVHGAWSTSFVHGRHTYLIPVTDDRGPDGLGRARTYDWPPNAIEVRPAELRDADVDVVVLQREHELELTERWLGRKPGRDVPAVYVEHDTPTGSVPTHRHPLADRADIPIVHVTYFNDLIWDSGRAPTFVVEHGIVDPGYRYTGELPRIGVTINEPVRRWRFTGTDLLPRLVGGHGTDVFGMGVTGLPEALGRNGSIRLAVHEDLPQRDMHHQLARRRLYLHPFRWTSLGLSLIEAMQLGMPVVALATTEAVEAVPDRAGVISTNPDVLADAVHEFLNDPDRAHDAGRAARAAALERYSLDRFLRRWDTVLKEVAR